MSTAADSIALVLGRGGPRPGVSMFDPPEHREMVLSSLPPGHSVYAIDVDPEEQAVAFGTRVGTVEVIARKADKNGGLAQECSFTAGVPIISVCLLGPDYLATGDASGRCLLWSRLDPLASPRVLATPNIKSVCGLLRLSDGHLAGLTIDNEDRAALQTWSIPDGQVVRLVPVPPPPRRLALVRMSQWPSPGALVYLSRGGDLVLCGADRASVDVLAAHKGDAYGLFVMANQLFTVGVVDRSIKAWAAGSTSPVGQWHVPAEIIGGQVTCEARRECLLISQNGVAEVYALSDATPKMLHRLANADYRVAAAPSSLARAELQCQRRLEEAHELERQIRQGVEAGRFEELGPLYARLEQLGFGMICLMLQAQAAAQRGDVLGELEIRHRLAQRLPAEDPLAMRSWSALADVLERTWQLADAQALRSRIKDGSANQAEDDLLAKAASILSEGQCIVVPEDGASPDSPYQVTSRLAVIRTAIQAATVLNKPFVGRWAMQTADPLRVPIADLTAQAVARKSEQLRLASHGSQLPPGQCQALWWLNRKTIHEYQTLIIAKAWDHAKGVFLCRALQISSDGMQTIITPAAILDAGNALAGEDPIVHNARVLQLLDDPDVAAGFRLWLQAVDQVLTNTLRQLRTGAMAGARSQAKEEVPCPR